MGKTPYSYWAELLQFLKGKGETSQQVQNSAQYQGKSYIHCTQSLKLIIAMVLDTYEWRDMDSRGILLHPSQL